VPRSRFVPVKKTSDLLVLRSDAYRLAHGARVELADGRHAAPIVDLDDEHFKLLADFDAHFPAGPPSLAAAERLEVRGDVEFGRGVVVRGSTLVEGPCRVEDGARLEGRLVGGAADGGR
jgi:UTP--glucose-1-phosphate uridylyltransferase